VYPAVLQLVRGLGAEEPLDIGHKKLTAYEVSPAGIALRDAMLKRMRHRWLEDTRQEGVKALPTFKLAAAIDPCFRLDANLDLEWGTLQQAVRSEIEEQAELIASVLHQLEMEKLGVGAAALAAAGASLAAAALLPAVRAAGAASQGGSIFSNRKPRTVPVLGVPPRVGPRLLTKQEIMGKADEDIGWYFSPTNQGLDEGDDPIAWWLVMLEAHPVLAIFALMILCVPASAAEIERLFSAAGFVYNKFRYRLDGDRADDMLVVRGNFRPSFYKKQEWQIEQEKERRRTKRMKLSGSMASAHAERQCGPARARKAANAARGKAK
jgi:hypothetical protein